MIPQIEPSFDNGEADAVSEYIKSGGWLTEHHKTKELQEKLLDFIGTKFCWMVPNGTTALILACMALGIKKDDEVIVPALTMIATANAPKLLGAKLKYVDVDRTGCLGIDKTLEAVTEKTKAVIYVSLNGRCNDLYKLKFALMQKGVHLIEDACQALGSYCRGEHLGTIGDIGCFSLSPHKIISTGQGGFVITDNSYLAIKLKKLKDFGREVGGIDFHEDFGINAKFTDLQAVVGLCQLAVIRNRIERKREIYKSYRDKLEGVVDFIETDLEQTTPWFVDIYTDKRDDLASYLLTKGIATREMYPPVYTQPSCKENIFLLNTYDLAVKGLWLPSSVTLQEKEIEYICRIIKKFLGKKV